jgi:hypothetical protein
MNKSADPRTLMQQHIADAEETFDELDADANGMLDIKELARRHGLTPPPIRSHRLIVGRASLSQAMLAKKLGQRWAKKDLLLYFNRMMRLENLYGSNKQADTIGDSYANVAATCIHVGNLPELLEDEEKLRTVFERFGVVIGLGRIVALYYDSSTLYHIH